ncbi:MAG: hypothetical protein Pars2KO_12520 [Parasphingorhabdus sp.]
MTEGRHSHWIETPTVIDLKSGRKIFSLSSTIWDAEEDWHEDGRFTLLVRRYPDPYTLPVHFDTQTGEARLDDQSEQTPISKVEKRIERYFEQRQTDSTPQRNPPHDRSVPTGVLWIQAIAGLIAFGLIMYLVIRL